MSHGKCRGADSIIRTLKEKACNKDKFIKDLLKLIFSLSDQLEKRDVGGSDLALVEQEALRTDFERQINRSKDKIKMVTQKARRRQVQFEQESSKKIGELQVQRRDLMQQ